MGTERVPNLTEQENLVQGTCFMHSDNNFSKRSSCNPEPEDLFDKFSLSKAVKVEEQECLKRASVIDRNLAVPFKKRKQLHEESDNCDVSTDHNLQKSDNNEETNVNFCPKFEEENIHESTSKTNEEANKEGKIVFELQSSVFLKADDSIEWIRLKCFDSISVDGSNSATFFTGGPIQSSAFFMTSHDLKVNQYVAVAVSNVISNDLSYTNTKNMSGIIQLWNLGSLYERKLLNQLPSMELALYHDNGIITEMKWCPVECFDKSPSACHLPRLGLLAASFSDSCVYIYSIPQPDFMPKLKPSFPIYFTQPFMKLTPLFGGPSNVTRKAIATCIEWSKSGEQIVAGFGNGAICVWMINIPSYTSHIGVKRTDQSYIIQPYLFFQPSGASITRLSFAPFDNHRWLFVLSVDGFVRFFDLLDTSAPFKIMKQGLEKSCMWGETFCGVYTSVILNHLGLISLTATDCCVESTKEQKGGGTEKKHEKEKEQKMPKNIQKFGLYDSSTHVAVSGDGNFHAIADMAGTVTVNFLNNLSKPLETFYLTHVLFETEIIALHTVDLELKTSESKIKISGNVLNNETSSVNDTIGSFYIKTKQESSSSSSSSGFCSPKQSKTIVIDISQCFEDVAVNLLKDPPKSCALSKFEDRHINELKASLNKPKNSDEETDEELIKCPEFSEDLMHDLLMMKVSNQSKSSSHILPLNSKNNSSYCVSEGSNYFSGEPLLTSPAASDSTGDTIVYPLEDYFCDTSHSNVLKFVESNVQSKKSNFNETKNTSYDSAVHKMTRKPALELEFFAENSLNSCSEVKSGNSLSNENSSSKNCCIPKSENCDLIYENKNPRKINYFSSDHILSFICSNTFCSNDHHLTSKHSDIRKENYLNLEKSAKEIMKNEDSYFQNRNTKGNLISKKDTENLSVHSNFDDSLCNVMPNSLNPLKSPLPDSSTARNDFIICDRNDKLSYRALKQSSAVSDYSDDTILYSLESCDDNDVKYLNSMKPGAISQSLYISEQGNTFQDSLLNKMDEKAVLHQSETKPLIESCCSFTAAKSYHSEYETDLHIESFSVSDEDRNFNQKDILISNFHRLDSQYLCGWSEEKHPLSKELPYNDKYPQKLSYENLISSFGISFKNSLDKSKNPLKSKKNDIYVEYNPLSVIKTISWNPNKGCQSWLFIGGNSGIGQIIFVPIFSADLKKSGNKKKRNQ